MANGNAAIWGAARAVWPGAADQRCWNHKKRYVPWYPKAVAVLEEDWERMVAFYDFPEAHWKH